MNDRRMRKNISILLACFLMVTNFTIQADDPVEILINNVRLIDRQGIVDDVIANLLIIDGKLDVVSKDDISIDPPGVSVDAEKRFLMGKLDIGQAAAFVILDQDPRTHPEMLLDTKPHIAFAIINGEIVNNNLPPVVGQPASDPDKKRSGWLAYNPPPIALPLTYADTSKWNRWDTKAVSGLFTGAIMVDRTRWLEQDAISKMQVGDLSDFEGGEVRALRLGAVGTLNFKKPWVYTVFGATSAFDKGFDTDEQSAFAWFDYRLDIPFVGGSTLSVGKQKEPISMERLMSLTFIPWQERSAAADALLPSRNHGLVVSGNVAGQRVSWAGGLFNNWIDNELSFADSPKQYIGRVTWLPFLSADESNLIHLGLGVRRATSNDAGSFQSEPEVDQAPLFVNTGLLPSDQTWTYNLEASWRRGPFWLSGEYLYSDVGIRDEGGLSFDGFHIGASWSLTGEMRSYRKSSGIFNQLPVAQSVYQGGWGDLGTRHTLFGDRS